MRFANVPVILLLLAVQAAAQPVGAANDSDALRYRRVFIPEGTKDWPQGSTKYLPMNASEFERLVEAAQRTTGALPAQSTAGLVAAEYEARLKGQTLQGGATLDFSPAIASSLLMTLDPCNLAISRAQWVTSDGAPAELGISGDGRTQVLAERGGQMKFDWSLAAQSSPGDTIFQVGLPPCPLNRMHVELPNDTILASDRGIVSDEGPADAGFRRWKIELGGWPGCRLHVSKKANADARRQIVLARQTTAYDLSLRGAELDVQFDVDSRGADLRTMAFDLEAPLELIEAKAEEQSLTWNVAPTRDGKGKQIILDLPPESQRGNLHLQLRAVAPVSMIEAWKLPRLIAEGVVCRTSTVRLHVSRPLSIAALVPHNCGQTGISQLKRGAGESLDFMDYDADAGFDITLVQRPAEVQATVATATILGQGKMSSRVTADFRAAEGSQFVLRADVLPRWTIDAVESQPADALDDWTLEDRGGKNVLSIRLAHPLSPERPLRLVVSARRLYAYPSRNLRIDDVVPLRYAPPAAGRRLVDLRAAGTNELGVKPSGKSWRADVRDLTAAELDLFPEQPGDFLMRDDPAADILRFSSQPHRPTYDATIRAEAIAGGRMLEEDYTILCTPDKTAPVDRLVVRLSARREAPVKWSIAGLDEGRFTARRLTAAQASAAGLSTEDEIWEISLHNSLAVPIELRGSRRTEIVGAMPLSLASLPYAANEDATITVRSFGPQALEIESHRLTPIPIPPVSSARLQSIRAAYRYDPREESAPQIVPAIIVKAADSKSPLAWAWDCSIQSRIAADGAAEHSINYLIESGGRRQIDLKLPAPLVRRDVHGIWIDGKPATAFSASDSADLLSIDLPPEEKMIKLELRLASRGAPLSSFQRLAPPLPSVGVPVFSGRWTVELPPGFAALNGDRGGQESCSFRERLLGGMARGEAHDVFNPFRSDDWKHLIPAWPVAVGARPVTGDGWSRANFDLREGTTSATVIHSPTIDVSGWLLFLAIVGFGSWPRSARPRLLLALAVLCGTFALLVPAAVAAVFSRGLLAILFCSILRLVRRRLLPVPACERTAHEDMPSTLTNIAPYAAPLLAAILFYAPATACAGENVPSAAAYSVFIPVNNKQQPSGGPYLVPESFFSELYRRAAIRVEKPQGWMIVGANYRAALIEDPSSPGHTIDRLTTTFDIHVFNAPTRVRIPIRRSQVSLVPGQALLDDHPVQPEWDADGRALGLEISEPGQYRLELTLRPSEPSDARRSGFDVDVPRVPGARLELTVPPNGPAVEVPSALGGVHWEEIPSRWVAEIGPAHRLSVRWQESSTAAEPPVVEQLQWLKLEPGCALLDVRLKSKNAAAQVGRFQVKADRSLALLPGSPATAAVGSPDGDTSQTFECQMPPSNAGESTLDLHFVYTGASGVGVFRAPQVTVVGSASARRWLAVSADPSLEFQVAGSKPPDASAAAEFIGHWGASERAPEAAFHLNGNAAEWSLTSRTRKPEIIAEETATWTFDTESAELELSARMSAAGGDVFDWRLAAPSDWRVDSIAALLDGKKCNVRWSQQKDGRITIFPPRPAAGDHTLIVRGRVPFAMKRKTALPIIRFEDVRVQSELLRLLRRPTVRVTIAAPSGLAEVKSVPADLSPNDRGDPIRSYYIDPAQSNSVYVTLDADRPNANAAPAPRETVAAPRQPAAGGTRIAGAEVRLAWQADGRCVGVAAFDVESASASGYLLKLPRGFELLRLTVDNVLVDAIQTDAEVWRVPQSAEMPEARIAMLYSSEPDGKLRADGAPRRAVVEAPRLDDLAIDRCTWVISPARGQEVLSAQSGEGLVVAAAVPDNRPNEIFAPWQELAQNDGESATYKLAGHAESLTVEFVERTSPTWAAQLADAIAFLVAMLAIGLLFRRGLLSNWLEHWPYLFGVCFGLAWWLWASPSAVGLVIVLAVLGRQVFVGRRFFPAVQMRGAVR